MEAYLDTKALIAAGATVRANDKDFRILTFSDIKLKDYQIGTIRLNSGDLLQANVDKALLPFVTGYHFVDNFNVGLEPKRQLGHYRLGTAFALLEIAGDNHYHVKVHAKTIEDLRDLYHLIRAGKIWPAIDYEVKQIPPPYLHLRDLVSEIWRVIHRDISERLSCIRERVLGAY